MKNCPALENTLYNYVGISKKLYPKIIIERIFTRNPCRKCVVLPCCKTICKEGIKYSYKVSSYRFIKKMTKASLTRSHNLGTLLIVLFSLVLAGIEILLLVGLALGWVS